MRLASLLLVVGSLAAVGLVGCASPTHDAADSDSAEAMTGIPNAMNLRMEYDLPSSTIHATVGTALQAGEVLRLQIRRGRLPQGGAPQLDCSKLPAAPVLPAAGFDAKAAAVIGYDTAVTYQGPLVDPSLLATVYDPAWIEAHVSPAGLAELQTEGADSIVEACIVNAMGNYARSRVQTTIANAWNASDPILDGHALTSGHTSGSASSTSEADATE